MFRQHTIGAALPVLLVGFFPATFLFFLLLFSLVWVFYLRKRTSAPPHSWRRQLTTWISANRVLLAPLLLSVVLLGLTFGLLVSGSSHHLSNPLVHWTLLAVCLGIDGFLVADVLRWFGQRSKRRREN